MRDPIVREFVFFDSADKPLFVRTDAEQATWQADEYSLICNFPFVADKRIERGMRVCFDDEDGVHQFFEVRKVKTYTPDGYQELTCEHIVISELTDVHTAEQPLTNVTPAAAVQAALASQTQTGALLWQVGNVTATATSSGDIGLGSVWQNIRSIEQNWNVYILPRVTYNTTGITGRYLDIIPADSANRWRGMRLSIDKNMDEAGVTVDDTDVKTALYGYGGTAYTYNDPEHGTDPLDKKGTKIDLKGATWSNPPANATLNSTLGYIEDTAATTAYGRNGKPRFGFYQNSDITDQGTLILKTWEALQATNKPRVTIDCMLRDLYRMGYDDEPVRLHDLVQVELLPVHDNLRLEIIKLSVDLLDPTATRPTIGVYIPNIVYIQRQTAYNAAGGVSSTLSGRRGGGRSGGQTKAEAEWSEFQAGIEANNMIISLHAEQVTRSNEIIKQAGMSLDAQGVIIYATDNPNNIQSKINVNANAISAEVTNRQNADNELSGRITVEAGKISQIVTAVGDNGKVTAASIVLAINNAGSSAVINADQIKIETTSGDAGLYIENDTLKIKGYVSLDYLQAGFTVTGDLIVNGSIEGHLRGDVEGNLDGSVVGEGHSGYFENGVFVGSSLTDLRNAFVSVTDGAYVNNTKTVTFTKANGTTVPITFSRATTLTGAVDGSKHTLTVTATPQGNKLENLITMIGHWGSANTTGEVKTTYYGTINATPKGGTTQAVRTFIVDALDKFETVSVSTPTNQRLIYTPSTPTVVTPIGSPISGTRQGGKYADPLYYWNAHDEKYEKLDIDLYYGGSAFSGYAAGTSGWYMPWDGTTTSVCDVGASTTYYQLKN
jgi:hypothetical protein